MIRSRQKINLHIDVGLSNDRYEANCQWPWVLYWKSNDMGKTAEFRCHKAKWETSSWKSFLEALVSCKYVFYQWRTFCLQKNWFFPASIPPHPVDGSNYGFWTEDDCLTSETESINLSLRVFISLGIHCYEQIKRSCVTMMLVWMMKWTCTLNASFWFYF